MNRETWSISGLAKFSTNNLKKSEDFSRCIKQNVARSATRNMIHEGAHIHQQEIDWYLNKSTNGQIETQPKPLTTTEHYLGNYLTIQHPGKPQEQQRKT